MDLMRLGIQSRKTGIKPKDNLAKDRYDMEDIDEFFSTVSKAGSDNSKGMMSSGFKTQQTSGPRSQLSTKSTQKIHIATDHIPNRKSVTQASRDTADTPLRSHDHENIEFGSLSRSFDHDLFDEVIESSDAHFISPQRESQKQAFPAVNCPRSPAKRTYNRREKEKELSQLSKNMALTSNMKKAGLKMYSKEDMPSIPSSSDGESYDINTHEMSSIQSPGIHNHFLKQDPRSTQSLPSPPPDGLRRSKRTKIAPLAYWRNERIIYTRANQSTVTPDSTLLNDIRKVPLQEIVEVIHVPEKAEQELKAKGQRRIKKQSPSREPTDQEKLARGDLDPEFEGSAWFQQKHLECDVFGNDENMTSRIIAWAPEGGEFQLPLSSSSQKEGSSTTEKFKVASLFNIESNVFAAGLLEFPSEGFKSLRTSGDSSFIFHVASGMIQVTLNSESFVVIRGCSFEIPKYNLYSFKNLGPAAARLFFVQCQVPES